MQNKLGNKVRNHMYHFSDMMELFMGVIVGIAVIVAIIGIFPEFLTLWDGRESADSLTHFLEYVFNIVIGIEFLKMLCKPKADTIIEVLIFLVARHMVIGDTTAVEDLFSVISMGILFFIKMYIVSPRNREGMKSFLGKSLEEQVKKEDIAEKERDND